MPKLALLVIDMLNDFFDQQPKLAVQRSQLAAAINQLIHGTRENGYPVIWIRQEFRPDLSDGFLSDRKRGVRVTIEGTDGCAVLPELRCLASDVTIVKKRYSAFFRTSLDEHLASFQPDILVVCGINSHACVRATAIDAYQRDYEVIIASECVGSYDAAHHEMTLRYLDGDIARALSNAEILKLLAERRERA